MKLEELVKKVEATNDIEGMIDEYGKQLPDMVKMYADIQQAKMFNRIASICDGASGFISSLTPEMLQELARKG